MHKAIWIELVIIPMGRPMWAMILGPDAGSAGDCSIITAPVMTKDHCTVRCEPNGQSFADGNRWSDQGPSQEYLQTA